MALYSYNGEYPQELPNRLHMPDGSTKTDKSTFTDSDIINAGWIAVEDPHEINYPNKLVWNNEWVITEPSEDEKSIRRYQLKQECIKLLSNTDYKVIKALEKNEALDPVYTLYRQNLRDFYNELNNIEDPFNAKIPTIQYDSDQVPVADEI